MSLLFDRALMMLIAAWWRLATLVDLLKNRLVP
jgi:hypothetical protein